jgi:hypothetical protein
MRWKYCPTTQTFFALAEEILQEYLKFTYEYFHLVILFGDYFYKLCPSNNPRRKNHKD